MRIYAERALVEGVLTGPFSIDLNDERIVGLNACSDVPCSDAIVLRGGVLTPGLLDLQINGSFGVDFAAASPAKWSWVLKLLAGRGVTGVEPTIITAPLPSLQTSLANVHRARRDNDGHAVARILGAHLEGPFISPARKGAHQAQWLMEPTREAIAELLSRPVTREILRTVTLAPELPSAIEATRELVDEGIIVSVGHSDATAAQVRAAADAGSSMTTHIFNAQRPMGHREPGVVGAVLSDDRFYIGAIVDGQHVDPRVLKIVMNAAQGRVVGVTDAIVTAGLPNGIPLTFGGELVSNDATGLGRRTDGTIAGAGITLDAGVRRMIASGMDEAAVLSACTEVAARSIGRHDLGHLRTGALADLVWWNDSWTPARVWVGGRELEQPSSPGV